MAFKAKKTGAVFVLAFIIIAVFSISACDKQKEATEEGYTQQPKHLPDVPLYPTGKVLEKAYAPDGSFQVRMLTKATRTDVLNFYKKRLQDKGWRKKGEVNQADYLVVFRKGSKIIHLTIMPTDNPEEIIHILNFKE